MFCVGLTGRVASGKSTVADLFAQQGVLIINADHIAKSLTAPGKPALQKIVEHFGERILTETGELNRRQLRDVILKNKTERTWLEQLLHPLIRQKIAEAITTQTAPYALIEIPLLIDRTAYPYLNRVLLVLAKPEQQLTRLMTRDHLLREEAAAMLKIQADETAYQAVADDLLMNEGNLEDLQQKVLDLHAFYLQLCTGQKTLN